MAQGDTSAGNVRPTDERERVVPKGGFDRESLFRSDDFAPAGTRFRRAQPAGRIQESGARRRVLFQEAAYKRVLALADLLAVGFSVVFAIVISGNDAVKLSVLALPPLVVVVNKAVGLYDRDERLLKKTTLDEAPALFQITGVSTLLMWIFAGVIVEGELGHAQTAGLWALLFASMLVTRATARRLIRQVTPRERCLVVGDVSTCDRVLAKFELDPAISATVVGRVLIPGQRRGEELSSDATDGRDADLPVLGTIHGLAGILKEQDVDRVIIAPPTSDSELTLQTVRLIKGMGVRVSVFPRLFEVVGSSVEFDDLGGLTLLGLRTTGLGRSSELMKRAVDVAGATLGLVLLWPFFMMIALAIKLTSPGPIFFSQRRIGRREHGFQMLKFRTMMYGADSRKEKLRHLNEAEGLFKITDDPRLTSVGAFLRRMHLDELPQLLNVLKGDMSLVGPRPLVPDEDCQIEGLDRLRLDLVPGMTGPWQVLGSSLVPLQEMVKIDYLYAANWSLWADLKILVRTISYTLRRRGR